MVGARVLLSGIFCIIENCPGVPVHGVSGTGENSRKLIEAGEDGSWPGIKSRGLGWSVYGLSDTRGASVDRAAAGEGPVRPEGISCESASASGTSKNSGETTEASTMASRTERAPSDPRGPERGSVFIGSGGKPPPPSDPAPNK
jgi:hypothetical protein